MSRPISASFSNSARARSTRWALKRSPTASRLRRLSAGVTEERANPCPPPELTDIDGTIGRPEKSLPLPTNASCTARGLLKITQGSRPMYTVITSP
eukprot:scaffold276132_cov26-Tisochrysis_lutea.AAC.1